MFANTLKVIVRNALRFKIYSIINITGLAVGITCFFTLMLFVFDETGFDTFNEKEDRIFRVYISSDVNGNASNTSKTPAPLGFTLKNEFPEVESYTRVGYFGQHFLRYKDNLFREGDIYAVDSTYFEIFTLPLIYGSPKTVLVKPNSIVISETAAKKYFGNVNPVGKYFIVDDSITYNITGVMKDFPKKSHFTCDFLISMSTYPENKSQNWLNSEYTTYVLFKDRINESEIENKLVRLVYEKVGPQAASIIGVNLEEFFKMGNRYGYYLQPLTSIYLYSQSHYGIELNTEWGHVRKSSIDYTYIFIAIGVFILLIAVFNFMNLTTAKSESRAKEVGIRKTLGSDRGKLIRLFLTESTLMCLFSVIIAYGLTQLVLPFFNRFVYREISFGLFDSPYTIPVLILFTLTVGILSGSYPAFYLSSFKPASILKHKTRNRKTNIRSLLVIVQFAISIALITGTLIIKNQLDFVLSKNLGFNKDKLLVINNASMLGDRVEIFKNELKKNPNIVSSTNSSVMFQTGIPGGSFQIETQPESEFITCQFIDSDYDFAKTYQIELLKGRYFSTEFSTDSMAVVINESAMKKFKTADPVGKTLFNVNTYQKGKRPYNIIGVVKDFNYESLHQEVRPLVLHISPVLQASFFLTIRINTENYVSAINSIKETWRNFTNGGLLNCTVLNENLEKMYVNEIKIGQITTVFSFIAIFIACLGLFGLAAFITEQRVKEIGIRKVLGASITEIVFLLSGEFTKWVVLANVFAWPAAYYFMNNWLEDFAYRIDINWWIFILAAIITLSIALATVSYQAVKAAIANPVESLKYE